MASSTGDTVDTPIFSLFVSDPPVVDQLAYRLWLQGCCEQEAATRRASTVPASSRDLVYSDTVDQFRYFSMLEHFLSNPPVFLEQTTLPLSASVQQMMVERYYEFDEIVVREFLGKKLTVKLRKELEDVHEKTGIALVSCRRQFENFRRVFKIATKLSEPLVPCIIKHFCISEELAARYGRVIFMCFHRLETTKRKTQFMLFSDLENVAGVIQSQWTDPQRVSGMELDTAFTDSLRDIKTVVLGDKDIIEEFRQAVRAHLVGQITPETLHRFEAKFKDILKGLLLIASGLNQAKEVRDFFVDVVEKIGEVGTKIRLTEDDMEKILQAMTHTFQGLKSLGSRKDKFEKPWVRFMNGLMECLLPLYNRVSS